MSAYVDARLGHQNFPPRRERATMPEHHWMWMDYEMQKSEIHCTDIFTCQVCGKTVRMTGNRDPVPGKCKGPQR